MIAQVQWHNELINKYNVSGPRYTSYPTALQLTDGADGNTLINALNQCQGDELSLYIHIPFCHQLCYYCGCNKIVTRHQHKADLYLDYLGQEMALLSEHSRHLKVKQLHLGGGTPTFLDSAQMHRLMTLINEHFNIASDSERSIEVDPRALPLERIDELKALGFNRISFGVQDFNDEVQNAVNRPQCAQDVEQLVRRAQAVGFTSVNVDMIYGLPKQSTASFARSIARLIDIGPDRVSIFNYAHLPERFAAQRKIKDADLPSAQAKLTMFKETLSAMLAAGYQFIGMDHFAKPEDELAVAQRQGHLHRNFQGYTLGGDLPLLGLGVSAISQLGNHIIQNHKELKLYYQALEHHTLSACKALTLNDEDHIRAAVIKQLICHFELDMDAFSNQYHINFKAHFANELAQLQGFINDDMLSVSERHIRVTAKGILFIRIICMCFDQYLQQKLNQQRFSRVI
ncbi:oxygen-independent coproporphyrinogen III oxidase [Pseudoalteromonas sp. CO325X]|uniref:oxygen-independent coproporphyrinogen III oxidase n=1 Tax=Pseudoalteromonas sp. CO325X TaxID=1777262 RepID=UPI001023A55F|nr:oxygen-independent coproporphyrinogen III oxidase [Pseudoalteromonas sp. CO325X]RZF79072.1 oxygen-independent coproporphyrinogen III oxidase [Pseudoalteromonas sp. CO325X]